MQSDKLTLVLASASPRRKELLGWMDIPFVIHSSDIDENSLHTDPVAICKDVAQQKGVAVLDCLKKHPLFLKGFNPFVVSADTIVTLGDMIFGKPKNVVHASEMLMALSDKTHKVITAVYLGMIDSSGHFRQHVFSCETDVTFSAIPMDILSHYLSSGDSLDKAGAYGIQGKGLTFVSSVSGSYSNVVGFPLSHFIEETKRFLHLDNDDAGAWRQMFSADVSAVLPALKDLKESYE